MKAVLSAVEHDLSAAEMILDDMACSEWGRQGCAADHGLATDAAREPSLATVPDREAPSQAELQRQPEAETGSRGGFGRRREAGQRGRREDGRDRRETTAARRPLQSSEPYPAGRLFKNLAYLTNALIIWPVV